MAFTLYILKCADGTFYIGHTDNLDRRLQQHEQGKTDAYTASRRPLKLVHAEEFESRIEALTMERKLKGWSRAKKQAYMTGNWQTVSGLAKGKHRHQRES
ncbi:MAG: GIY-YIG nuclease family protein [Gammaproteobacteria bacterium]